MCSPMPDIDPADIPDLPNEETAMPTIHTDVIQQFVRDLGFDPADVPRIEISTGHVAVHQFVRDANGQVVVSSNDAVRTIQHVRIDRTPAPRTGTEDGR